VFYLRQDHYFLEEFSRSLQYATQKTSDNQLKDWLHSLYTSTINIEMEMQKQLLNSLAASSSHSNTTASYYEFFPCRTTLDYASYLMNTSSSGTFSEIVSVMAPGPWTYLEIAQKLSKIPIRNEIYRYWLQFYSSNESRMQVAEIKEILNRVGEEEDEKTRAIMKNHFTNACKYEYLFWEMAYHLGS
jgi:thiaminase/transcriptional activator TenA